METAILIMFWLLTCALCVGGGYFYAVKNVKHRKPLPKETALSGDEERKAKRIADELSNFYKYDGTEQG